MHVVVRNVRILALLQRNTLTETKNRTLKCLKWHYSTVRSMKNVAVLTEDRAFALFFRLHPGGFDSSRVPNPGNLPSKAKKKPMPPVGRGWGGGGGGGGGLGAGGIDWCIKHVNFFFTVSSLAGCISLGFTNIKYCKDCRMNESRWKRTPPKKQRLII